MRPRTFYGVLLILVLMGLDHISNARLYMRILWHAFIRFVKQIARIVIGGYVPLLIAKWAYKLIRFRRQGIHPGSIASYLLTHQVLSTERMRYLLEEGKLEIRSRHRDLIMLTGFVSTIISIVLPKYVPKDLLVCPKLRCSTVVCPDSSCHLF